MHQASIEAMEWWAGPRKELASWIENYQKSLQVRHRSAIARIVAELQPRTLLEVGSHCGPNLVRVAQEIPTLRCAGFDASEEAITAGTDWVRRLGLADRIALSVGRLPAALDAIPTGAFDVVLSCYTLGYLAPEDLDATLYEMGRVAKQAVILAEPMDGPLIRNPSGYHEWAHPYREALPWIGSCQGMTTRIVPVTPPVDRLSSILVAERSNAQ